VLHYYSVTDMSHREFIVANASTDRDELIALNIEYLSWVFDGIEKHFGIPSDEIVGMPATEYVPTVIHKVCGDGPPSGVFYLLRVDGGAAGMGGIRFLRPGVAEIKRIYVRPRYRGMQLGELILNRLISDATEYGYRELCLDSGPFMTAAQRIYEAAGFNDCAAYEETEVPAELRARWRFMVRDLE
jgi:GNAT superfamily N-acetyltransferase